MDKYGRKVKNEDSSENLKKFYRLKEAAGASAEGSGKTTTTKQIPPKIKGKQQPPPPPKVASESESEEEEDDEEAEGSEDEDDEDSEGEEVYDPMRGLGVDSSSSEEDSESGDEDQEKGSDDDEDGDEDEDDFQEGEGEEGEAIFDKIAEVPALSLLSFFFCLFIPADDCVYVHRKGQTCPWVMQPTALQLWRWIGIGSALWISSSCFRPSRQEAPQLCQSRSSLLNLERSAWRRRRSADPPRKSSARLRRLKNRKRKK